jgi:hypothetical protein
MATITRHTSVGTRNGGEHWDVMISELMDGRFIVHSHWHEPNPDSRGVHHIRRYRSRIYPTLSKAQTWADGEADDLTGRCC